jgi:hypothetical protein
VQFTEGIAGVCDKSGQDTLGSTNNGMYVIDGDDLMCRMGHINKVVRENEPTNLSFNMHFPDRKKRKHVE